MPGTYVDEEPNQVKSTSGSKIAKTEKRRPARSAINTLGGLKQSEDEDEDADKPAEFYTGGEKSGLGVIDPTKKKDGSKTPSNVIQEILRKAAA